MYFFLKKNVMGLDNFDIEFEYQSSTVPNIKIGHTSKRTYEKHIM
jgi:hypothetical protein